MGRRRRCRATSAGPVPAPIVWTCQVKTAAPSHETAGGAVWPVHALQHLHCASDLTAVRHGADRAHESRARHGPRHGAAPDSARPWRRPACRLPRARRGEVSTKTAAMRCAARARAASQSHRRRQGRAPPDAVPRDIGLSIREKHDQRLAALSAFARRRQPVWLASMPAASGVPPPPGKRG